MTLLDQIDWTNHDGVNHGMINDFMRNQFYDRMLSVSVQDQHCVDIGFGTGLLSMLALKHGAQSVVAYESDPARYELGSLIIQELGLANITLLNQRFDHGLLDQHKGCVFFSETVSGNLWQEGLFSSLPRLPGTNFLPKEYFLEMWACVVPDSFASGLADSTPALMFDPGVDVDQKFVDFVNQVGFKRSSNVHSRLDSGIKHIDTGKDTPWGWIPYMRLCAYHGQIVAGYSIQAANVLIKHWNGASMLLNFDVPNIELVVDTAAWKNCSVVLMPRMGLQYDQDKLYLDTGHWGLGQSPILVSRPAHNIKVSHNVTYGNINYSCV